MQGKSYANLKQEASGWLARFGGFFHLFFGLFELQVFLVRVAFHTRLVLLVGGNAAFVFAFLSLRCRLLTTSFGKDRAREQDHAGDRRKEELTKLHNIKSLNNTLLS